MVSSPSKPDLPPALEKSSAFRAHAQDRHELQKLHGTVEDPRPHVFNPSEEQLPKVLAELCDPETSLVDVACIFDTTVHALSVWMTRPEIAQQLTDFHNAAIVKARTAAACQLQGAITALALIVNEFNTEHTRVLWDPHQHSHIQARIRSRECTRRAATLLTRLARLAPARILPPGGGAEPSPRGDGAGATAVLPPLQRLDAPSALEPLPVRAVVGAAPAPSSAARVESPDLGELPVQPNGTVAAIAPSAPSIHLTTDSSDAPPAVVPADSSSDPAHFHRASAIRHPTSDIASPATGPSSPLAPPGNGTKTGAPTAPV